MMTFAYSILFLSCTNQAKDTSTVDTGTEDEIVSQDTAPSDSDDELPSGLSGTEPSSPVPVPDFTATNYDGGTRTSTDLVGHPTVVWFFPAAATPG